MNSLSEQIEQLLLDRRDWVTSKEIVARFGLPDDRPLRQVDGEPGACSHIAISRPGKGFKHIECATSAEWERFKRGQRNLGVGILCRIRALRSRRNRQTRQRRHHTFEKISGQGVLL
jgi:hypothetical protein